MIPLALASVYFATPDFSAAWGEVESQIRGRYYARASRKADMERLLEKYAPLAKRAKTEEEFDAAMDRMAEEFGDSHFGFFIRSEPSYYLMDSLRRGARAKPLAHFGAWLRPAKDGMTVQMILDGGEAEKAGLRKGDVLMAVGGGPLTVDALRGKPSVNVQYRRGGEVKTTSLAVREQNGAEMFLDATRASVKTILHNGRRIGYIRLWTLVGPEFRQALARELQWALKDTDGFILDLRDGFGGRPEGYAELFGKNGYTRPLVVLTNEGTRSAKELLSYSLQKSKRATLAGKVTAGHVLGTYPTPLDDWAYLEIPMAEVPVDGVRLEKKGVKPDVLVPTEYDSDGRDLVLAKGVELLKDVPVGV